MMQSDSRRNTDIDDVGPTSNWRSMVDWGAS